VTPLFSPAPARLSNRFIHKNPLRLKDYKTRACSFKEILTCIRQPILPWVVPLSLVLSLALEVLGVEEFAELWIQAI